jgi:hypothetical protein
MTDLRRNLEPKITALLKYFSVDRGEIIAKKEKYDLLD